MTLIQKNDVNQIFAINAPDKDKPASFANYPNGWDVSRSNNGKPTIKQFNYLQQRTDQNVLWIHQNGGALPYDENMEYAEGAPVVKNGELVQKSGDDWDSVGSTYGIKWKSKSSGYALNERVMLDNGDIVKSEIPNNTNNPNSDMTGWELSQELLTLQKLNRENVSVWDFFTKSEIASYKANFKWDAYRPIQAFFDFIATNDVGVAYCSGVFSVSQGLLLGRGACLTKQVVGSLYLTALNAIDVLLTPNTGGNFTWTGTLSGVGHYTGSAYTYLNKTCRLFMTLPKTGLNSRSTFGTVIGNHFRQGALFVEDNSTLCSFDQVRAANVGTGYSNRQYTVAYNGLVNTGASGSGGQLSTLTVATMPESDIDCQKFVYANGTLHMITASDPVAKTISVYPWILGAPESGTIEYIWGSGVDVYAGNSSCVHFNRIDVANSAIGLSARSLYLPSVNQLCVQGSRLGVVEGQTQISAGAGGSIGNYYTETMLFDLVFVTLWGNYGRLRILSSYEPKIEKTTWIGSRWTDGRYSSQGNTVEGFQYSFRGYNYYCESPYQVYKSAASSNIVAVDLFSKNLWRQVYYKNTIIFPLSEFTAENVMKARMFGLSTGLIHVIGTGVNAAPTSITFPISNTAGFTLNGGTTDLVFTGFGGIAQFVIYIEVETKNYVVKLIGTQANPSASVTYDPPSIDTLKSVTTTVTLTGVVLGDSVQASFNRYNADIEIVAQVSAVNTVTVKFKNTGDTAVDLASGTLTVKKI